MNKAGHRIASLHLSGGLCKSELFIKSLADVIGMPVVLPKSIDETVTLGAAMCAAAASGLYKNLQEASVKMNQTEKIIEPTSEKVVLNYHAQKYIIYRKLCDLERELQYIMNQ